MKISRHAATSAVGVLAMLVAAGGTVWTSPDASSTSGLALDGADHQASAAFEPRGEPATVDMPAPGSSTGDRTARADVASTSKAGAARTGRVVATVVRSGPVCTDLYAYRLVDQKPVEAAMFTEKADRTISGRLRPGTYVFHAVDDCDTDLESVWVGGTSSRNATKFRVRAGATTQIGTVTLTEDPDLKLTFVSAADGSPVAGEPFDVYDESGEIVWSWGTDEAGQIRTTSQPVEEGEVSLRSGTYRFRVAGNEFAQVEFTIDLEADVTRTYELEPLD